MSEEHKINVDDIVDDFSDERVLVAAMRAFRACGVDCSWDSEGHIEVNDDSYDSLDEVFEREDVEEAFEDELRKMAAQDIMTSLVKKGYLVPNGLNEDGEVKYVATQDFTLGGDL